MKFNMQEILQQAQKMQSDIERIKKELDFKTVTAESGGGMVTAVMTGSQRLVSLQIAKELIDADEIKMLEDLIVAAVNKATEEARNLAAAELKNAAPNIPNIPGFNL